VYVYVKYKPLITVRLMNHISCCQPKLHTSGTYSESHWPNKKMKWNQSHITLLKESLH